MQYVSSNKQKEHALKFFEGVWGKLFYKKVSPQKNIEMEIIEKWEDYLERTEFAE